jgi:hypothetical protein
MINWEKFQGMKAATNFVRSDKSAMIDLIPACHDNAVKTTRQLVLPNRRALTRHFFL